MEPFRVIIEKALMKSFNLGQLDEEDFTKIHNKYVIQYKFNKKYLRIFVQEIFNNREDIFAYVKSFYFVIFNRKGEFPFYKYE